MVNVSGNQIYLDKWDNYFENDPKRLEVVEEIVDVMRNKDHVEISFDYEGRTRHETASHVMKKHLIAYYPESEYKYVIYGYRFKITKR